MWAARATRCAPQKARRDGLPAAAAPAAEGPGRILLQTNNLSTVGRVERLSLGAGCLQKAELLRDCLQTRPLCFV